MAIEPIEKTYLWRSRFSPQQSHNGLTYIHYVDDMFISTIIYALLGMFFSGVVVWLFNFKFFPLPPQTQFIDQGYLLHFFYWLKSIIHAPLHFFYKSSAKAYYDYYLTLQYYGYAHLLTYRLLCVGISTIASGYYGFFVIYSNPVKAVIETHVRGLKLLDGEDSANELQFQFKPEIIKSGKFVEIAENVHLSFERLLKHLILIGASGTGKTQYLILLIKRTIQFQRKSKLPLKLLALDPKEELAKAYYKDDGTMAVINANHALSYVPSLPDLLRTEGLLDIFIKMVFPAREKEDFFDSSSKEMFKGLVIYLLETLKDSNGNPNPSWSDLSDVCDLSKEQMFFALNKYYPSAAAYLGSMDSTTGELNPSETSDNILLSFNTAVSSIKKIGRYWYDNPSKPQKTINLTEFICNPNYKIKSLFLQTNALDSLMGNMVLRIVLMHCAKLIESSPNTNIPQGVWVCDEVHRPGALLDLDGSPIFKVLFSIARSKGWGCNIACQSILDLESIYKPVDIDAMREACSSFIVTGTPHGKTNESICNFLSEAFIDKSHVSTSGSGSNMSSSRDIQEHAKKVLLQSELTSVLNNTKTHMRYLAMFTGLPNAYILEKEYLSYSDKNFDFIEREKRKGYFNPDSKINKIINTELLKVAEIQTIKTAPKQNNTSNVIENNIKNNVEVVDDFEEEYMETWNDTGQHMDAMSEEEKKFYEEDVENEAIKSIAMDSMIDNHGITTAIDLFSTMLEKTPITKKPKILQQTLKPNSQR